MVRLWALTLVLIVSLASGCRSGTSTQSSRAAVIASPHSGPLLQASKPTAGPANKESRNPVHKVSFQEPLPPPQEDRLIEDVAAIDRGEFYLQQFVAEVVARYPSIQAMAAAWRAASERYPQAVALDDPMFMVMAAPDSFNSPRVESGYTLEVRQKLPWFGKRALRGDAADEEASAAAHEVDDARLRIALVAQTAYLDYYLADRQILINDQTRELLAQFREIARARYQNNLVTQQDVLQADVELADVDRRRLELERMRKIAVARMNTLLLRAPDLPLPPPNLEVASAVPVAETEVLHAWALQNRPDLAAQAHRVAVESANLELAYKQFFPDADVFGRYDAFWQEEELRGTVGLSMNLPVYRRKLNAAVSEAQFRLQRERAEYDQLAAEIGLEVQTALEQLRESQQTVRLYEKELLPVAEQYLAAARSNYEVGKATALDFVQAQRQLVVARDKQLEAIATLAQRIVELERNVGGTLPLAAP